MRSGVTSSPRFHARWRLVVRIATWFTAAYLVIYVIVPLCRSASPRDVWGQENLASGRAFIGRAYNQTFAVPWVKDAMTAVFPVALLILSMSWGGVFSEFYSTITQFGIYDVRADRRGQDPTRTPEWIDRISRSKEVVIVGTHSKGWFHMAFHELDEFLAKRSSGVKAFRVYLLDPLGEVWRAQIERGSTAYRKFWDDVWLVLSNLEKLFKYDKFKLYFYDSQPISCVVAKGMLYLGLYLPRTDRREVPELTISQKSFLGDKIYGESIEKLVSAAPPIGKESLVQYMNIILEHANSTADRFCNDPRIHCDFCKEAHGLPETFSRLFPDFGRRVAHEAEHFVIIPTIGQIVPEHVLLVSNIHATSSAQLEPGALKEIATFTDKWAKRLKSQNKIAFIFEHGLPFESAAYGGCGVCHCHIHALSISGSEDDLPKRLKAFLAERGYSPEQKDMKSWDEIAEFKNSPYIAVRFGKGSPILFQFPHNQRVESQLMRQFAAHVAGDDQDWDWRVPKKAEELETEREALKKAITNIREMLK